MRRATLKIAMAIMAAAALAGVPSGAAAQPIPDDAPELHTYRDTGTPRADANKPLEQIEQERRLFRERTVACDGGDVAACGELGESYWLGIGTPQVRPIAGILFDEACAAGDAESCYRSGVLKRSVEGDAILQVSLGDLTQACDLGSVDGCIELARSYVDYSSVERDLGRAESILKGPCNAGNAAACRELGIVILKGEPDYARSVEAMTLLDSSCKSGDVEACREVHSYIENKVIMPALPHEPQVLYFGCVAGEARHCKLLGDRAFLGEGVVEDPAYAFEAYDRACALEAGFCHVVETMRAVPELRERCAVGHPDACARMGEIANSDETIYFDPIGAADLLSFACRGGEVSTCEAAGRAALDAAEGPGSAAAHDAREFLDISCSTGQLGACSTLAGELYHGGKLGEDRRRALEYYAVLCADDRDTDCEVLERHVLEDPSAPLPQAGSNFLPPDDPETGESAVAVRLAEMRAKRGSRCETNTLSFRGREYTDTLCDTTNRVINARLLNAGDAPWQALLWRPDRLRGIGELSQQGRVKCGGSVIAHGWVLTAAHCLVDYERSILGRGYTIRLGVHNPRADEGTIYPIRDAFVHPDYDPSDKAYDIALIRYWPQRGQHGAVPRPYGTIDYDRVPVERRRIAAGMPVYVYGWGATDERVRESTTGLRSGRMELTSLARCDRITGYSAADRRNTDPDAVPKENAALCALGRNRQSACSGDSGGPLIYYGDADDRPRVVGVVSGGPACGQTGVPGKYARVGLVSDWIRRTMSTGRSTR